jgi:DNA primase
VALVLGEVSDVELEHPVYRRILDDYRTALGAGELLPAAFFLQHDDPAVKEVAIGLVHSPHELSPNWEKKHDIAITDRRFNVRRDIGKVVGYLKARKIDGLLAEVTAQLRAADADPDLGPEERAARTERLLAMFQRLKKAKEALAESAAHTLVRRK